MYKIIIYSFVIIIGILSGQALQFSSEYLTDDMRSSPKNLIKFREVGKSIEGLQKQIEFYKAVSEAFGLEIEKLDLTNSNKFQKYDKLVDQYLKLIETDVEPIIFPESPEIKYTYKPIKLTKKAVQKQSHKRQSLVLLKNYINLIKYYKEKTKVYTNYLTILKELKETGKIVEKEIVEEKATTESKSENIDESISSKPEANSQFISIKIDSSLTDDVQTLIQEMPDIQKKSKLTNTESSIIPDANKIDTTSEVVVDEAKVKNILEKLKTDPIISKSSITEKKEITQDKSVSEIDIPVNVSVQYINFLDAYQSAKTNRLSVFNFQKKEISFVTREQFREAMINARIFGKDTFTIGDKSFSSKLKIEKTEKREKHFFLYFSR